MYRIIHTTKEVSRSRTERSIKSATLDGLIKEVECPLSLVNTIPLTCPVTKNAKNATLLRPASLDWMAKPFMPVSERCVCACVCVCVRGAKDVCMCGHGVCVYVWAWCVCVCVCVGVCGGGGGMELDMCV